MKEMLVTINIFVPTGNEEVANIHKSMAITVNTDDIEAGIDEIVEKVRCQIVNIKKE